MTPSGQMDNQTKGKSKSKKKKKSKEEMKREEERVMEEKRKKKEEEEKEKARKKEEEEEKKLRASQKKRESSGTSLQRKPSLLRRALEELGDKVLKRSLSFAGDLHRSYNSRGRSPWTTSLSSLHEDAGDLGGEAESGVERRTADAERAAALARSGATLPRGMPAPGGYGEFPGRDEHIPRCYSVILGPTRDSILDLQGLNTLSRRRPTHGSPTSPVSSSSAHFFHDSGVLQSSTPSGSLPALHKFPPEEHVPEHTRYRRQSSSDASRRSTKLRRQEAFKNDRSAIAGRSRSLTHIDALDGPAGGGSSMLVKSQDMDSRSEPDTTPHDRLIVPAAEPPHVRRQKLARSQVSSSEYFSVSFECGDEPREEFVPAEKGVTLADALSGLCAKRGVDLANALVFVDSQKAPHQCLSTDTAWMGGKHVRIRAKDDKSPVRGLAKTPNNQFPPRKSAGSYRGKSGRFFSASTEDPGYTGDSSHEGSFKGAKASKQRWSGLFGNSKDTKMESLVELLNSYTKQGIPCLSHTDSCFEHVDENLLTLEEDWKEIVPNPTQLPERQMHQQTAIWELVQTELAYIKTLKVVTDLFLACLQNLQASNILNEIDTSRLFSNITSIYSANSIFWTEAILPMLRATRDNSQPLDPSHMLEGFLKFDDIFHPYQKYCGEQLQCQLYCREKHQENEMFTAYLAWCETQKDCNRLRLMDILVKPMQRLTKYSLLLKAILKNTQNEQQRTNLDRMIRCVDEFVHNVNTTMRQKEDHERLRGIIARIESYDVVDSKDDELEKLLRSYCELDLTSPMPGCHVTQRRYLLFESDLKFRDNTTSKMDVHCFLLTDMLLICKPATKRSGEGRMRVVRQPFVVERLMVHELGRDPPGLGIVYLNEYRTATAAFILTSGDTQLIKNWADQIRKAQDSYAAAKHASASATASTTQVVTRQPSNLWNEEESEDVEELDCQSCASLSMGIVSRSPRGGSSRGSRMSSLAHSHSGSMDMNEVSSVSSISHSRGVSVENELRASSLSSDEGIPGLPSLTPCVEAVNKSIPNQPSVSPRSDRRAVLCKSPTPNTLTVQVPVYSSLGQSLPNLSLATSPGGSHIGPPNPPNSLLLVPPSSSKTHHHHGGLLSPGHRGVSYPPPSPPRGSLRRGLALPQSRNPPLIKTRHVNSSCSSTLTGPTTGSSLLSPTQSIVTSHDFDVPVIAGVSPPSEECTTPVPSSELNSRSHRHPVMKRLARTENRRYHTAGAIDDLKKQNSRDTSIHKRLSWNCGQGQHQGHHQGHGGSEHSGKCISTESVHSSSGVSSTGSVQFGSLASELEEIGDTEGSSLQVVCENPSGCYFDNTARHSLSSSSPSVEAINMDLLNNHTIPTPADTGGVIQTPVVAEVSGVENSVVSQYKTDDCNHSPSREEIKDSMLTDPSLETSNV